MHDFNERSYPVRFYLPTCLCLAAQPVTLK